MASNSLKIGCVADDFTGASDAASFLRRQGMKTVLYNEIPKEKTISEACDAVVIALKSRTTPVKKAVEDSLQALRWLRQAGARQLYIKYCSTFDSTKEGNIGPVLDAALEMLEEPYTILCPALPVNGRTVKDGCLYVNGIPLNETHMKNHPLTPMWDSDIANLMKEQSKYSCLKISAEEMKQGKKAVEKKIRQFASGKGHFYVIPDYYEESHAELIYQTFGNLVLLSGGSGLLGCDGLKMERENTEAETGELRTGKSLLLAGSCSNATLEQIEIYRQSNHLLIKIEPQKVFCGEQTAESLWREAAGTDNVLFYSSDLPMNVKKAQRAGKEKVSQMLEEIAARLVQLAVQEGYTQIIVAGGETSGAVTKGLGYQSYLVGESVAPGVPIMVPVEEKKIRLVLKSGNFGQPDFFERAIIMTTIGKNKRQRT